MLKLLATFFASLAGTHKHDDITHQEVEKLKRSLKDTNTIIAQQLETIDGLKKVNASQVESIQERTKEKEHYILELETAVHQLDELAAEVAVLKEKLRVAQNEKTGALALKQENEAHQKKILELEEDNEAAISMLEKFAKELQKT